jgi:hypothetical protein
VLLTDGEDTASMVGDEQVIDLARRAGVVLYPVGLPGQAEAGGHSARRASGESGHHLTKECWRGETGFAR